MGGILSSPKSPKVDTSAIDAAAKKEKEKQEALQRQVLARRQNGTGNSSLLFGTAEGVPSSSSSLLGKLGG